MTALIVLLIFASGGVSLIAMRPIIERLCGRKVATAADAIGRLSIGGALLTLLLSRSLKRAASGLSATSIVLLVFQHLYPSAAEFFPRHPELYWGPAILAAAFGFWGTNLVSKTASVLLICMLVGSIINAAAEDDALLAALFGGTVSVNNLCRTDVFNFMMEVGQDDDSQISFPLSIKSLRKELVRDDRGLLLRTRRDTIYFSASTNTGRWTGPYRSSYDGRSFYARRGELIKLPSGDWEIKLYCQ